MQVSLSLALTQPRNVSGGGGGGVSFQSESREASIALVPAGVTTAGDSLTQGNGTTTSPTDYSWPKQFRDIVTGGTALREEVGGMAWEAAAQGINTDPITLQVTGQGATGLANYVQFVNGSINNYNNSVMGGVANTKTWEDQILTGLATAVAAMSSTAANSWTYFAGVQSEIQGPGMIRYASWRNLIRRATALYGARVFDIWRYLQFRGSTDTATLDYKNVNTWGTLPITFRGMGQDGGNYVLFDDTTLPTAWVTVNTATNTHAGIEAAGATAASYAEGTLLQNINTGVAANSIWRVGIVSAAKKWVQWDNVHLSRWGYEVWKQAAFDIAAALQDDGAPVGCPAELFCAQDAASSAACGTIHYIGSVQPASIGLFTEAGVAVDTLTLVDNGVTNNAGTITVTRSGSGTLTEGAQRLILQTTDAAGHVLHSPVDFRVGQPSTQTIPRLWTLPGTTLMPSADFSMQARSNHGMADSDKFGFALWLRPVDFSSDQQYVIHFAAGHGNSTTFQVRISTGGNLNIIANNPAGTLVLNTSTSSVFTSGQPTWVAVDIDLSVSTPTVRGYYNKNNAATDTAISTTGVAATGPTTLAMSNCEPRFFALKDATIQNENWTASDVARDQFRGAFGNIIMWNGSIGIDGTPSVARLLWQLGGSPGQPTARAPYSAINGVTPIFDIQGGIGDFLRGGFNQSEPVYGTYRGIVGLT